MSRSTRPLTAAVAAIVLSALVAGSPAGLQSARATDGNAVTRWSELAQPIWSSARPGTSGIYVAALMHVAIYDAVVAIEGGAEPFLSSPAVTLPVDVDAAVGQAARDILVAKAPAGAAAADAAYSAFMADVPEGSAKEHGKAVGAAAAAAVIADRAGDGLDNVVPWIQPTTGPGVFEPFPASPPAEVKIGQIRPIALQSAAQFRAGGPAPLTSDTYAADFDEVKALGRKTGSSRTPAQTEQALFWSENPFIQWHRTLRELALARDFDAAESARFLAMTSTSFVDGLITCFESKYHFVWWRPLHAIPRADSDGNPATVADTTWEPLLVVNHPEYPSGHGCASGAVIEAITAFFGTASVEVTVRSTVTGTTETYPKLQALKHDIFMARIYGGLHFRSTMGDGFNLGKQVGRFITRDNFGVTD